MVFQWFPGPVREPAAASGVHAAPFRSQSIRCIVAPPRRLRRGMVTAWRPCRALREPAPLPFPLFPNPCTTATPTPSVDKPGYETLEDLEAASYSGLRDAKLKPARADQIIHAQGEVRTGVLCVWELLFHKAPPAIPIPWLARACVCCFEEGNTACRSSLGSMSAAIGTPTDSRPIAQPTWAHSVDGCRHLPEPRGP